MATLLNFTKTAIDALPFAEGGRDLYQDSGGPESQASLYLRVGRQTKVFYFIKKLNGVKIRYRIGTFPEYAVKRARKDVRGYSSDVDKGIDPRESKRAARQRGLTLADVVDQFIEYGTNRANKPFRTATVQNYQRALNVHFSQGKHTGERPYTKPGKGWATLPAKEITFPMVADWYDKAARYSLTSANAAVRCMKAAYNYQIKISRQQQNDTFTVNPFVGLEQADDPKRSDRLLYTTDKDGTAWQFVAWFDAVDQLINESTADYMRLLLLSGMRRGECASIRWDYVDLKSRVISLPGRETKNRREHLVPLSDAMLDLLSHRYRKASTDFVFASEGSATGHIVEPKKAAASINKKAELSLTLHGLRRSYLQIAENEVEASNRAIKQLMNHAPSKGDVTAANYSEPLPLEKLLPVQQRITDAILRLAGRRKADNNVVALEVVQ